MKKIILIIVTLAVTVSLISFNVSAANDYTTGKQETIKYINSKGLSIKEGTPEYFNFLGNLLWGKYNKDLQTSPHFKEILKYAAHYYAHPEILYPKQCNQHNGTFKNTVANFNAQSNTATYDPVLAVSYAYQYSIEGAHGQNPNFPDFRNSGGDCTNFASQVVNAGNIPLNGSGTCSSYSTITQWYVNRAKWWCLQTGWAWSTSWSVVGDFYTHQTQYENNADSTVFAKSQAHSLRIYAVPGDIIQLETGGSKWHSMIATKKQNGEIYLTYHSGPNGVDCVDHSLQSIINANNANIDHFFLLHFH